MSFLLERDMAQAALGHNAQEPSPAYPPVGARIREARERMGISLDELAQRLGLTQMGAFDLELHDREIFDVVDLSALPHLAATLGMPVMTLLFGEQPLRTIPTVSFLDVSHAIGSRAESQGVTVAALSETAGWELQPVLDDPGALGTFNLQSLFDICRTVGLDWLGVLVAMDADAAQQRHRADGAR